MDKQQEVSRLYTVLKGRFDLLLKGGKTSYERTLTTGNFKGRYTQNEEGIVIEVYSLKSELLVYQLVTSKDWGGVFVESIPYYRGMVHNLYYAGVYNVGTDKQELLLGVLNSIRTDEQRDFLLSLLLGENQGQALVNALGKVIEYLDSGKYYESKLSNFEIFSNYLDGGYKYSFEVSNGDEGDYLDIFLNIYEGEFNEEVACLGVECHGLKTDKSLEVFSINYKADVSERFTIEGFDESKIQICVDNLSEVQGVEEEEFVKLLERVGFKL